MSAVLKPATEAELSEMIAGAEAPLEVIGSATKRHLGHPVQAAATLDMSAFSGVIAYEPEELILDVGAATPLAEIEGLLSQRGQQLAFEPPDWSALLGSGGNGTVGGLVACNLSGPRRIKAGAARDHILGIHGVTGAGDVFKAGARVVKNVTGYDMPKLLTGSYGTLAALTSVILKVLPAPETEETVVLTGLDDTQAVEAMSLAMQSSCEVSAAAAIPGEAVYLRLEGIAPSVAYRRDRLGKVVGRPIEVMAAKNSAAKWRAIRDGAMFAENPRHPLWRISAAPSEAPAIVRILKDKLDIRYVFDWAGGLIWLEVPPSPDASAALVRSSFTSGHATLIRAPESTRAAVDVFQPQATALAALTGRVKDAFDPRHILNPGRMYRGALMQTNFTAEQLATPRIDAANQILRKCVHCGFCTATCPTYVLLGDELDSPRGRIYLMKNMLESGEPADARTVKHLDRCLSCLSCMTTCPSGVNYMHLVDQARAHVEETYRRPLFERLLRNVLAYTMPRPHLFRLSLIGAKLASPLAPVATSFGATRIAALLDLVPKRLPTPERVGQPGTYPATGEKKGRVALLMGCVQSVLDPGINAATIRLLTRLGYEVVVSGEEACCGSLTHHMGLEDDALARARRSIDQWTKADVDQVIVTASGCGTTIKDYGHMLRHDPAYAEKAKAISAKAMDVTEFLIAQDLPQAQGGLRLAYHSACSMQHGQNIRTEPQRLLRRAGFTVMDVPEGHLCCGSAGTYNILQPEIATKLRERKVANIESLAPQAIATGNIGCITQIGLGTKIPIVHTVELLDWVYGGPKPEALP